jgi:hypothetical protein
MELTWITIAASLSMGLGAACIFIFAVKKDWFRNLEDVKYQVFWSDLEERKGATQEERHDGQPQKK